MSAFDYVALDEAGRKKKGALEADSARQIRQQLRDKGLTPLFVNENSKQNGSSSSRWFSPRISTANLALITRQLATLIQAGLPVDEALATVAQQSEILKIRSMLFAVRGKVLSGHSFAESLGEFPRAFPVLYRATIAAGEQSGFLDKVLVRLADYTEASQASRQQVMMALFYPIILLLMSVLIVTGLMVYVVPDVVQVFVDTGHTLPLLTRALMALSGFISDYGLIMLALICLSFLVIAYINSIPRIKLNVHRLLLDVPILGRFSRNVNTARFASTLSILTASGVPLVEAMKIARQVLTNRWIQNRVHKATQNVTEGESLHKALQQAGYFPPMMIHMIASGEASGELDSMLERVANSQERDAQNFITITLGLVEPIMLLFMGGCVLLIVLAILLPILNINQLVG